MYRGLALVLALVFVGCGGGDSGEKDYTAVAATSSSSSSDVTASSSSSVSSALYPDVTGLYRSIVAGYEYTCHNGDLFTGSDSPNQFAVEQDGENITLGNLEGIALPDNFYIKTTIQTFNSTKIDEDGNIYKASMLVTGNMVADGIEYEFVSTVTLSGTFASGGVELRKSSSFTLDNDTLDEPISCGGTYIQHYYKLYSN